MNWDAIGSIGEILSAAAVLATLIYLAIQIRHLRNQGESTQLHHIVDRFSEFTALIAESEALASILTRGRIAYSSLSDEERLRFDYLHISLLNFLESWHMETRGEIFGFTESGQTQNLTDAIDYYCNNPGFREFWKSVKPIFPVLAPFMEETLEQLSEER
jgi:hypothetical protein